MKKFILSIILACACALTVFAFTACGNSEGVSEPTSQTTALNTIAFGEKYKIPVDSEYYHHYLILNKDGTAVSTYYYKSTTNENVEYYYVDLKWEELSDKTLIFIYVKATYKEDHTYFKYDTESEKSSSLSYPKYGTYSYSRDVLSTSDASKYVRENSRLDVNS